MKKNGLLVSFEGISGCGKTYLSNQLKHHLPLDTTFFIKEVSDRTHDDVDSKIIEIIRSSANKFFQNGIPYTETLLLLALKVFDYEKNISKKLEEGFTVVEDRSIDTVAVYQSIIINQEVNDKCILIANDIFMIAKSYRRIPDITFLINDNFESSINRAELRNGKKYSDSEILLLKNAESVYNLWASEKNNIGRINVLDRRFNNSEELIKIIKLKIQELI